MRHKLFTLFRRAGKELVHVASSSLKGFVVANEILNSVVDSVHLKGYKSVDISFSAELFNY